MHIYNPEAYALSERWSCCLARTSDFRWKSDHYAYSVLQTPSKLDSETHLPLHLLQQMHSAASPQLWHPKLCSKLGKCSCLGMPCCFTGNNHTLKNSDIVITQHPHSFISQLRGQAAVGQWWWCLHQIGGGPFKSTFPLKPLVNQKVKTLVLLHQSLHSLHSTIIGPGGFKLGLLSLPTLYLCITIALD